MSAAAERDASHEASLRAVAELFGGLLLREPEAADLERLRAPELALPLEGLGIALPSPAEQDEWLEERGADYHRLFLSPDGSPLVQSLWTQGRYEGDAAVRVRQLAAAAGVSYQRGAARGAPPDHLGSLLLLWSACLDRARPVAAAIARDHLEWSARALARVTAEDGFYGALARGTRTLVAALVERERAETAPPD